MDEVAISWAMLTTWLMMDMSRMTAVGSKSSMMEVTWLTHVGQWRFGMRKDV